MTFPTPPQKVASFFSAQPPTPSEIGAQFDEIRRSIGEILGFLGAFVRPDGVLRNQSVGREQISPEIGAQIASEAVSAVQTALSTLKTDVLTIRAAVLDVHAVLDEVQALKKEVQSAGARSVMTTGVVLGEMKSALRDARAALADARNARADAENAALSTQTAKTDFESYLKGFEERALPVLAALPAPQDWEGSYQGMLYPQAGGFYAAGDTLGSTAVAQDYAQCAMEWAEHMPDTIPPNILAVMNITGSHWSSRWWALRAQQIVQGGGGGSGIADAPIDAFIYGRSAATWVQIPIQTDAPNDGGTYGRGSITPGGADTWVQLVAPGGVPLATDAPNDAYWYGRHANAWTSGGAVSGTFGLPRSIFSMQATKIWIGAITLNWLDGEFQKISLTGNATITVSNWPSSGWAKIALDITNTGAFTITWPAGTVWAGGTAPVITSGAGKRDWIVLMTDDGGTSIVGSVVGQDFH